MTGEITLARDYEAAGFSGHLPLGRSAALVVIDLVDAYLVPESPLYAGTPDVLPANVRVVEAARAAGIPIIFTNVTYLPDGSDGGMFRRKVPALSLFDAGSPYAAFPRDLTPEPTDWVLSKQYPSAFFATPLASALHAKRIDTVLLTGFSTSGCVRASALDALCHGFAPFVIAEACGDRDPAVHAANLFDIGAKCGEVISEGEAIAYLAGAA
jgi:maleamate amidohydrolase